MNRLRMIGCMMVVLVLLAFGTGASASVLRVDRDSPNPGNGSNADWSDAYHELYEAINAAASDSAVTEIWVAEGTYMPDPNDPQDPNDACPSCTATFHLLNDVSIKGGHRGYNQTGSDERDRVSILSGNIGNTQTDTDNCYSVVTGNEPDATVTDEFAVLDGFTIRDGNGGTPVSNAFTTDPAPCGAGIFNPEDCRPTIQDCHIMNNKVAARGYGGGMCNLGHFTDQQATQSITNCVFEDNEAPGAASQNVWNRGGYGGGLCNLAGKTLNITDCTFVNNKARKGGGLSHTPNFGDLVDTTEPLGIVDALRCTFQDNEAESNGGAVNIFDFPENDRVNRFRDCEFLGNAITGNTYDAEWHGGGVRACGRQIWFINCLFQGNTIIVGTTENADFGGGLYLDSRADETDGKPRSRIIDCVFDDNSIDDSGPGEHTSIFRDGGGIYYIPFAGQPNLELTNVRITNNKAAFQGGGIYAFFNGSAALTIVNCTIADNAADGGGDDGGGVYAFWPGTFTVLNSILWGNTSCPNCYETAQLRRVLGNAPTVKNSCIQDADPDDASIPFGGATNDNIDDDPLFVAPAGSPPNYRLHACSPAIDAGNPDASEIPEDDQDVDGGFDFDEPTPDLDLEDRVVEAHGDGPIVDMGAYETAAYVPVYVDIELSPTLDDTDAGAGTVLNRCITFELWDCFPGLTDPIQVVNQVVSFPVDSGLPHRVNGVELQVQPRCYTCITARDELHTLRSTAPDLSEDGATYSASFVGNPNTGGHWLVGGNLNDDRYIDVLDFGTFITRYQTYYGTGDTSCSTPSPHPDVSGDGLVFTGDFTFIQINFLQENEENCCGAGESLMGGGESMMMGEGESFGPMSLESESGILRLDFANGTQVPDGCLQPGSGTNETLVVRVDMRDMTESAVGGQYMLTYDPSILQFEAAEPGDEPFTREVFEEVNTGAGEITYATGIEDEGTGTTADTTMAYLYFTVINQDCASTSMVRFAAIGGENPPTKLSGPHGVQIDPALESLPAFGLDGTGPYVGVNAVTCGEIEADCYYTVTFSGFVLDDCGVQTVDVSVDVTLITGDPDMETPVVNLTQVDPTTVLVNGSVRVSAVTNEPATVQVTIDATDGCGNAGEPGVDSCEGPGLPPSGCPTPTLRLVFENGQTAPDDCVQPYSGTNETLVVRVQMTDMTQTIVEGQFALTYDSYLLDLAAIEPGDAPFSVEVFEDVDEYAGTISYGFSIPYNGEGTTADTTVAYATFVAVVEDCASTSLVRFDQGQGVIPTLLLGPNEEEVHPDLEALPVFTCDGTGPLNLVMEVNGGNVDENCEFVVTFSGFALDNCGIQTADVIVGVTLSTQNATLGTPDYSVSLLDPYTAYVEGNVVVSALQSSPATVEVTIDSTDPCGNAGEQGWLSGDVLDEETPSPCP